MINQTQPDTIPSNASTPLSTCTNCGKTLPPNSNFCTQCGLPRGPRPQELPLKQPPDLPSVFSRPKEKHPPGFSRWNEDVGQWEEPLDERLPPPRPPFPLPPLPERLDSIEEELRILKKELGIFKNHYSLLKSYIQDTNHQFSLQLQKLNKPPSPAPPPQGGKINHTKRRPTKRKPTKRKHTKRRR